MFKHHSTVTASSFNALCDSFLSDGDDSKQLQDVHFIFGIRQATSPNTPPYDLHWRAWQMVIDYWMQVLLIMGSSHFPSRASSATRPWRFVPHLDFFFLACKTELFVVAQHSAQCNDRRSGQANTMLSFARGNEPRHGPAELTPSHP